MARRPAARSRSAAGRQTFDDEVVVGVDADFGGNRHRLAGNRLGVERLVEAIDRLSLERKAPATQSIWRDALDSVVGPEQGKLDLDPEN